MKRKKLPPVLPICSAVWKKHAVKPTASSVNWIPCTKSAMTFVPVWSAVGKLALRRNSKPWLSSTAKRHRACAKLKSRLKPLKHGFKKHLAAEANALMSLRKRASANVWQRKTAAPAHCRALSAALASNR